MNKKYQVTSPVLSQRTQQELRSVVSRLQESFIEMKRLKNEKYALQDELEQAKAIRAQQSGEESINGMDLLPQQMDIDELTHEKDELTRMIADIERQLVDSNREAGILDQEIVRIKQKETQVNEHEAKISKSEAQVEEQMASLKRDNEQTEADIRRDTQLLVALQKDHSRLQSELARLKSLQKKETDDSESEMKHLHYELSQTSSHLQELLLKNKILNEQIQGILAQETSTVSQIVEIQPQIAAIDQKLLMNLSRIEQPQPPTVGQLARPSEQMIS